MADFVTARLSRFASGLFRTAAVLLALVLLGCNTGSVTDGLTPTAQIPPAGAASETALAAQRPTSSSPDAALAVQGATQPAAQPTAPTQNASLSGPVSPVSFLPVTGAPQSAVSSLAVAMRKAAKRETIQVVVSVEQGARYQVKGYFSALNDGTGTILVYVWDVLDQNGTRVHRISGQERGQASPGDPWSGIGPGLLERIADVTMNSLRTWMSTRPAG